MAGKTLTAAIKDDHQEMYDYYDAYKKASGDTDAHERWARQLTWEVARHAVGEEIVVYPLMEKHLGAKGIELADHDRAEHQRVKEDLYHLESLTAGTEDYDKTMKKIMEHLRPHNDDEEQTDLPMLEPALGEEGSKAAAAEFKRTKKFVPTRTHPSAPNKPPFETFAAFLAAPVDKLKDEFAKFPTDEMKEELKEELQH
ncbi:hypothetical protein NEOLEDRAFT_1055295 [Neolentinus lepideus HHB14362 ss-1]|uniref:Hemerythrin-like domain-containing protein n=1 Tax=Neolentinus lepideus HHB14362 ss-1 TaxID=1314782 RepID=A0A165VM01_9AGAM|nr:hypothetical protein NEOLEDRAFT_1055295 [Neolentinus lepideus HHB14362 ss-1]